MRGEYINRNVELALVLQVYEECSPTGKSGVRVISVRYLRPLVLREKMSQALESAVMMAN